MRCSVFALLLLVSLSAAAQAPSVYKKTVALELDSADQNARGALK